MAECARSTSWRNSSRYFGSVAGKTGLQGSMLCTLNFSATCAAKFFNSICSDRGTLLGVLPSQPFHPTINSRNGYAATAIRLRGSVGNVTEGPEFAAHKDFENREVPATQPAHCPTNCLRVVAPMRRSVSKQTYLPNAPSIPRAAKSYCTYRIVMSQQAGFSRYCAVEPAR